MVRFKGFTKLEDLASYIRKGSPSFFHGSQTSTVVPFTKKLLNFLDNQQDLTLVDLTGLPRKINFIENQLVIEGPVTWEEAIDFAQQENRGLLCYPTELKATVLGGLATSATGDKSFAYGGVRSQVKKLSYMNKDGAIIELDGKKPFISLEQDYKKDINEYDGFKNPPFPRFENETDLMIGTEGQLGVLTNAYLETKKWTSTSYLFVKTPYWANNFQIHLEIAKKVQLWRGKVYSCELMDQSLLDFSKERPFEQGDIISLEVPSENLELVYEELLKKVEDLRQDDIFEVPPDRYRQFRRKIPAYLAEYLNRQSLVKMGTDAQVRIEQLEELFTYYQKWHRQGIRNTLFGHLGDSHLHFNFLPKPSEISLSYELLEAFYLQVKKWRGSPFAEHGIGVIKKKYISNFWRDTQYKQFEILKKIHDPGNMFFPMGFMSVERGL